MRQKAQNQHAAHVARYYYRHWRRFHKNKLAEAAAFMFQAFSHYSALCTAEETYQLLVDHGLAVGEAA